jgi:hypothetical protein
MALSIVSMVAHTMQAKHRLASVAATSQMPTATETAHQTVSTDAPMITLKLRLAFAVVVFQTTIQTVTTHQIATMFVHLMPTACLPTSPLNLEGIHLSLALEDNTGSVGALIGTHAVLLRISESMLEPSPSWVLRL